MADVRRGAEALPQVPLVEMSAEAVATDISRQGTAIANTQVAQNRSLPPEEWTGAAADAASAEIQSLGDKTVTLSQAFSPAATALNTWAEDVRSACSDITKLQEEWNAAVAEYNDVEAESASTTGTHGSGSVSHPDGNLAVAGSILSSKQTRILERYTKRVNDLDDRADAAAKAIDGTRRTIVSDEAGSKGRNAIGVELFGADTPILSGAAQWAHAQEIAPEIADALTKEPLTVEDIAAFNDKYGGYLQNPFYVAAIAQHVNMDDLYATVVRAGDVSYQNPGSEDALYRFNQNLGAFMAMSTGGSNLSADMVGNQHAFDVIKEGLVGKDGARIDGIVQAKLADMKATGRNEYQINDVNSATSWYKLQGYDILGQLMGYAGRENPSLTLGPGFYHDPLDPEGRDYPIDPETRRQLGLAPLDPNDPHVRSVFEDMVDWDYNTAGHARADSYAQTSYFHSLVPRGTYSEDQRSFDALQGVIELSDTPDYLESNDDTVLHQAEETRLQALRRALDSNTEFGTKMNTTRYLTGSRAGSDAAVYYDGGEALGNMINDASKINEAAMVSPSPDDYEGGKSNPAWIKQQKLFEAWQADDVRRAKIAQNFMLGYQDGLDQGALTESNGEDEFGRNNPNMRSWVGNIATQRIVDFAELANEYAGEGTVGTNNTAGLTGHARIDLGREDLQKMFGKSGLFTDLMFDKPEPVSGKDTPTIEDDVYSGRPPAMLALNAAAWAYYKPQLDYWVNQPVGDQWMADVFSNTQGWQTLISVLDQAPTNAGFREDDYVVQRNQMIRGAVDYALSYAPSTKLPSAITDYAKDGLLDHFLPTDMDSKQATALLEQHMQTGQKFQDALAAAYIKRDEWPSSVGLSKEYLMDDFLRNRGAQVNLPASQYLTLPAYDDMTEEQRREFADYLKEQVSVDGNGNVIKASGSKDDPGVPRTNLATLQNALDSAQQRINTKLSGAGK
ncbi:MAG: hypothetical protein KHX93_02825 [Actinomyces sp. oral taxon 181]|uniref:hypothetical protein n=1 Tax=uncultured Actinomyces sp. TaxID=249061 RepID=UPI0015BAFD2D|nr:hypothetical protein [uncultured Actinomyces sp.]MBS5340113.1 hypothetical protein [Actinomyces sp. oral taxon 181]